MPVIERYLECEYSYGLTSSSEVDMFAVLNTGEVTELAQVFFTVILGFYAMKQLVGSSF